MSKDNSINGETRRNIIYELIQYYTSYTDEGGETKMDYDTFLRFFDKLRVEDEIKIGDYTIRYDNESNTLASQSYENISYYRHGYKIGSDYIYDYYRLGEIMPTLETSFDDDNGIKNYDKLIDYLDYLYETNIEELKRQELEEQQKLLEEQRLEQLKEKKLNDFLGI
uniref:Uncharacterized protein n=1 Tax=Mammaliicoccus phage MSShimriz1 TaxID=3230127 RepID=A0AAU8GRN9_9VIRU